MAGITVRERKEESDRTETFALVHTKSEDSLKKPSRKYDGHHAKAQKETQTAVPRTQEFFQPHPGEPDMNVFAFSPSKG